MRKSGILPGLEQKVDGRSRFKRQSARRAGYLGLVLLGGLLSACAPGIPTLADDSTVELPTIEWAKAQLPQVDLDVVGWPAFALPEFAWPEFSELPLPKLPRIRLGAAETWAMPVRINGRVLRVPPPAGMVEYCAADVAIRDALTARMRNVELVACYAGRSTGVDATPADDPVSGPGSVRGVLTALRSETTLDQQQFEEYKQVLKARVRALQAQLAARKRPARGVPASQVLQILSEGHEWVVHAISRPSANGRTVEAGVVTSVFLQGQLLYLTVIETPGPDSNASQIGWPELQSMGEDWAEAVVSRTLWRRPS